MQKMIIKLNKPYKTLLVDGDILAWTIASICDGKYYEASDGHYEHYQKDIHEYCKDKNLDKKKVKIIYESEPEYVAIETLNVAFQEILDSARVNKYKIFLTGKQNFRYRIATIKPYKGNRKDRYEPSNLQIIRNYLLNKYNAVVHQNYEADDLLAMHQSGKTMICSTDKDLKTIPGTHFHLKKLTITEISETTAMINFYQQVLIGDSSDNIPGLFKVGKASKAYKAITEAKRVSKMHDIVLKEYEKHFGTYAPLFMVENCKLLWLIRSKRPYWMDAFNVKDKYWLSGGE